MREIEIEPKMDCPWTASDKLNSDAKTEVLLLTKVEYSGKRSTSDMSFWFLAETRLPQEDSSGAFSRVAASSRPPPLAYCPS